MLVLRCAPPFPSNSAPSKDSKSLRRQGVCANIPHTDTRLEAIMPENHPRTVMPRRDFIRTGASGLAGAALTSAACSRVPENQNANPLGNLRSATPTELQGLVG